MWYKKLSNWLKTKNRYRLIPRINPESGLEEKYLERFYILSTKWLGIYLHRFWADDDDGLHDHPWSSISCLLSGGYQEDFFDKSLWRKPLNPLFYFRPAEEAHRITLGTQKPGSTWTLFIRFKRKRLWGFYRNGKFEQAKKQSRQDFVFI